MGLKRNAFAQTTHPGLAYRNFKVARDAAKVSKELFPDWETLKATVQKRKRLRKISKLARQANYRIERGIR